MAANEKTGYIIEKATEGERSEIMALYKAQIGREFCPWDEDYPSDETMDWDYSRDALFVLKADGKIRIVQMPVNGFQPKKQDPRYSGFMEGCGDLYTRICYDRFIQDSGFARSSAEIAEAFGMPEEGLLCTLKQNGIIVENGDEEDDGWEIAEALKSRGLTLVKTGVDGKPETQWTYKGGYFVWLLLTKDCQVRPCYERISHG